MYTSKLTCCQFTGKGKVSENRKNYFGTWSTIILYVGWVAKTSSKSSYLKSQWRPLDDVIILDSEKSAQKRENSAMRNCHPPNFSKNDVDFLKMTFFWILEQRAQCKKNTTDRK